MFGILADLLSSIITILFPAFASYKAVRSGNPAQLTPWLMYWVVLSGILLAESWTVFIIGWFPFYSWIRLFFLSYLVLPQTQGARILFQEYVDPFFSQHEREIEELIGRTHERAKALGLQYFYQLIDIIREKVLRMPPAEQQQQQVSSQAAGAAGYAQSLLSRFNLPSATTTFTGPGGAGADWFSMITSALGAITSTSSSSPTAAEQTQSREAQAEQLSASGILDTEQYKHLSRTQRARIFSSRREQLEVLVTALQKEENKLHGGHCDDIINSDDDLAYGAGLSSSGLRKNASEHSFDQIDDDDLSGSRYTHETTSAGTHETGGSGGWTSGWFGGSSTSTAAAAAAGVHTSGGQKRPSARNKRNVSDSVEFAARAVDEIGRASGFSR